MNTRNAFAMLVAGVCLCLSAAAQPLIPTTLPVSLQQTTTTGLVGLTLNQSARLSVVNLNPVPATANVPPNCTVQLQFVDPQNVQLVQKLVPNFAPQTATWLDLDRKTVTAQTSPRAQIRGLVVVDPSPNPVASPAAVGFCTVMVTLEIFDNTTGSTVALTGDTRMVAGGGIVPLAMR